MIVTVERKTNIIVSAALRSKASANKQGNFLSSVAFALIHLLQHQKMKLETEFIELVSVIGYMNNIYEYVTVLSMMQEDWVQNDSIAFKGGLIEYVFQRIISLVGCVMGGTGMRCQTFVNRDLSLVDVRKNCHFVRNVTMSLV
jgi:hypothetical protein